MKFTYRLSGINRKEALRYLGIAGGGGCAELFDELEPLCLEAQDLRAVWSVYDIAAGDGLDLGFAVVKSRDLAKNLDGCDRIVLFACTAGVGIDRLITKYSRLSPARAAVVQAIGSSMAEDFCDVICARIREEFGPTKPRFSCGFGDLPLTLQRDIFKALDVTRSIGISLSDDCFMTPTKSVTAIVGIKREN